MKTQTKSKLVPINVVHTPESMKELQEYLNQFKGEQSVIAMTCAMMAWNLACKVQNED